MAEEKTKEQKVQEILSLLPGKNCTKCGFDGCEELARAIVNGQASPFDCQKDPSAGHDISKVLGMEDTKNIERQTDSIKIHHRPRGHGKPHRHGPHGKRGGPRRGRKHRHGR